MNNIYEIELIDILPDNIKNDLDIIAAAEAIDSDFFLVVNDVGKCILLPNIYNITDHDLLDLLAWDRHVDYYDSFLPVEQKQGIIDNSFRQHMKKGTPAAVEDLIITMFGDGEVEEWFDYGGDPYHFKVKTNNESANNEKAEEFVKAVYSVKNLRSYFDGVEITQTDTMNLYFAGIVHTGDFITIS
mgnify:CR=1 FL=1